MTTFDNLKWLGPVGAALGQPLPLSGTFPKLGQSGSAHLNFNYHIGAVDYLGDLARRGLSAAEIAEAMSAKGAPMGAVDVMILCDRNHLPLKRG